MSYRPSALAFLKDSANYLSARTISLEGCDFLMKKKEKMEEEIASNRERDLAAKIADG